MKDIGEGTIRRIDWTELTPVVLLLRVFNVALGLRILALALIGFWLTLQLGFLLGIPLQGHLVGPNAVHIHPERLIGLPSPSDGPYPDVATNMPVAVWQVFYGVLYPYFQDSIFRLSILLERPALLFWLPGFVLIWALCGGMICRIVAVRLTVDESESIGNLLLFFRKRGIGFVSSLIILSLGILCCFLPIKLAYWLAAVPGLKYVVAVLLPIPLLFAFFTVLLTLGLAAGWMLLFAAVSVDGSDGVDAISRMFSYIFQRPLHCLFYWFCSGILGWLGLGLVEIISQLVIHLCYGIISEGIAGYWSLLFSSLPSAYALAWFWTSSVAIYLLLRRSVDATPFNEVYRAAPPKVRVLPTIKPDKHGAPEIKESE